jgi:hypothetical protein
MNNLSHDLLNAGSYVLSIDQYDELCAIRDKLLLMAQLAGTETTNADPRTMLFIRRILIGQLFADLSFQIDGVLEVVAKTVVHDGCVEMQ